MGAPVVVAPPEPRRWRLAALAAAVAAGAALGFFAARRPVAIQPDAVTFQPKTFDRLPVTNARFMPDGQTIIYSAAPRGYNPDLFVISPTAEAPQPLGVSNAQLLAVSSTGELALIVGARHLDQRLYAGTLARISPRPMLEGVREADWSPDGASLAIVHDLGSGRDRLE